MEPNQDSAPDDQLLMQLLTDAKFEFSKTESGYQVALPGMLRPWDLRLRASNGWLTVRTYLMALPTSQTVRAKLLETMARLNGDIAMAKFCIGWDAICLCLEDRVGHYGGSTLRELLSYYCGVGERYYPHLLDIVRERENLESLEQAFKRTR